MAEEAAGGMSPSKYHILITGPSGSGKTYLAKELASLGYPAFDSDALPGLAAWFDEDNHRCEQPKPLTRSFLLTHRFLWGEGILKDFLDVQPRVLLFGISHNSAALSGYFDRVAILDVSPEDIVRNLAHTSRNNEFGKEAAHLEMARDDTAEYYRQAPDSWIRLKARPPELLIQELSDRVDVLIQPEPVL